jgi:hypothetical protein
VRGDRRLGVAEESSDAVNQLLELLFQLSITFSTEKFTDGQPSSTLLVYYSGVLGSRRTRGTSCLRSDTRRISLGSFISSDCCS